MNKNKAFQVGLVLGIAFIVMGFAYDNTAIWMMGLIFLFIGLVSKFLKK